MKTPILTVVRIIMILTVLLLQNAPCDENLKASEGAFLEIWHDSAYRSTNFALETLPDPQEKFYLSQTSADAGIRFSLGNKWFIDPYVALDLAMDWGNETWNKAYWNNNVKIGPGLRVRYEYNDENNRKNTFMWLKSMSIGPFAEYQFQGDALDSSRDEIPGTVPDNNWRAGFSAWLSFDSQKNGRFGPWAEVWTELTYNENNFYDRQCEDFFLFFFQPKIGIEWEYRHFAVQPYLKMDLSFDFGNNEWNKEPWLNKTEYGPGIRLSFKDIRQLEGAVFHIYAECLGIDYFSRVDKAAYENNASNDLRVGINFWLPFGATKQSTIRK